MAEQASQSTPAATSKKPDDTSAFKQQRMPAWQPVMSPPWVISCFLILGCIFIPIGIVVIVASDNIIEVKERYDHVFSCTDYGTGCRKNITITVPKKMDPPVLMYYELDNFFQNHRRYAKSRSDLQLSGELPDKSSMSDCDPFLTPGSYRGINGPMSVTLQNGQTFDVTAVPYNPCGLIAWSMFNDTFRLWDANTDTPSLVCDGGLFTASGDRLSPSITNPCEKKGIAWPSDPGVKYNAPPAVQDNNGAPKYLGSSATSWTIQVNNSHEVDRYVTNGWYIGEEGHAIPDPTDQDLMVWMRLASLSNFRKLYRRITVPLQQGTYTLEVLFRFPVSGFGGKKYFVLATSSWLGGKNFVLGGLYIATGVVCMLLGLGFLAKHLTTPRRVGAL